MKERDWIEFLRRNSRVPDGVVGIGDDAAVLPGGLLVTTDTYVEDLHFRTEWSSWRMIGEKIAQAAISDIAAMGGNPLWLFGNLSTSAGEAAGAGLLEGILGAGLPLLGGDTTGGVGGRTIVTLTVLGQSDRPILRTGARPGDIVYVSGPLGGAEAGLRSLKEGWGATSCEARFLAPRARVDLAKLWGKHASAMIDVSDGLSTELNHLSDASCVRIILDLDAVPYPPELDALPVERREMVLAGGDEYELVATSPHMLPEGIPIGRVEKGSGVFTVQGDRVHPCGYDHDLG